MTTNDVITGLLSTAGHLPGDAQGAAHWATANVWWIAPFTVACIGAVLLSQHLMGRRALRERDAFDVLPTTGFDPSLEDVVRWAKQIGQAQRSTSRWALMPARGTAMRIRLLASGGTLGLRVEGPARAIAILRQQGYSGCELRPVTAEAQPEKEMAQPQRPVILLGARRPAEPARATAV